MTTLFPDSSHEVPSEMLFGVTVRDESVGDGTLMRGFMLQTLKTFDQTFTSLAASCVRNLLQHVRTCHVMSGAVCCNPPPHQLFLDAGSPPNTLSKMKTLCYHCTKAYVDIF
uniref:Uncharacterized protein n=1 Tax=Timema tahoe TaxID=61484 RepID=A0A7R9IP29_9NEOP|nr:unnamed protein product [Timema tahoe]